MLHTKRFILVVLFLCLLAINYSSDFSWLFFFLYCGLATLCFWGRNVSAFSYIFQQQKLQPKVKSFPLSNVYCWFTSNRKNLTRTRPDPWIKLYSLFNFSIDNNWKYTTFEMFIKKTYNSKQIVNLFSCY